jgi:hypothetical protein
MTIKEQFDCFILLSRNVINKQNAMPVIAAATALMAELEKPDTVVDGDILGSLSNEERRGLLQGLVGLMVSVAVKEL